MAVPCLLKLPDNTWVHYSRSPANAYTRDFIGPKKHYPLPEQDPFRSGGPFEHAPVATMSAADAALAARHPLDFRLEKLPHTEVEKWRQALGLLQTLDWVPSDPPRERVIPQTVLRELYRQLRDAPYATHEAMANDLDTPAQLQERFAQSVKRFEEYENLHDTFCPTRVWWEADPAAALDAHELQALLDPAKLRPGDILRSADGPALGFTTVDYEVSPLRTTNYAVLDDGTGGESMGNGGMDLLLRSEDGVPVVAEIKGRNDTNLFFALVQALTYAVELTTSHQFKRLARSYPEAFHNLDAASPRSDVSIIYLEAEPPLKDAALRIARELLRDEGSAVSRTVRRIAFLRVESDRGGKLRFTCQALLPAP